jgi:hypothetical protein
MYYIKLPLNVTHIVGIKTTLFKSYETRLGNMLPDKMFYRF